MLLNIGLALLGTAVGIIFGAIPGMTATMAVAVFLPMTYAFSLVPALYLLLGNLRRINPRNPHQRTRNTVKRMHRF